MQQRRAIIHIGTGKTGTTAIQHVLAANRAALLTQGFAYPTSLGEVNHMRLSNLLAGVEHSGRQVRDRQGSLPEIRAALAAELEALPPSVHTVVFSNEHSYRAGSAPGAAARLKALLDPHFDRFRILVYLRRQDELAVSRYSTRLKSGNAWTRILPEADQSAASTFDYAASLAGWTEAFGAGALTPRIFARSELEGGDVVVDFLGTCGIGALPATDAPVPNASIRPEAQEFLRRLAERAAARRGEAPPPAAEDDEDDEATTTDDGAWNAVRQSVRGIVARLFAGPGRLPARAEAEAFYRRYAAGNEALRAAHFPDRATLFAEDFSRYPEVETQPGPEEVLEVALDIVLAQADGLAEAQGTAALAAAQRALAEGDRATALRQAERATRLSPADLRGWRFLIDHAEGPQQRARVKQGLAAAPLGREEKARLERRLEGR